MSFDQDLCDFVQRAFACPPATAEAVAGRATLRAYAARAVVLNQGDPCTETWLVMSGRAQAVVYSAEGDEVFLREYADGDLFGAIAQLDAGPHEAEVRALAALRAALFLAADFLNLIETHSALGLAVSRLLLGQLRTTAVRMVEHMTLSAEGRVCAELLRLAVVEADGRRVLRSPPRNTVLALRIHSTRETVSRAISGLERRGIVRREPDALVIVALWRLEEMVI